MLTSFSEVERLLLPIQHLLERQQLLSDVLFGTSKDVVLFKESNELILTYCEVLTKQIGLEDENLLPWFVFDNHFGTEGLSYNGTIIESISDLYNLLNKF